MTLTTSEAIVRRYERAVEHRAEAQADAIAAEALPWYRAGQRRRAMREATTVQINSLDEMRRAIRSFADHGVGADPTTWGVLSNAGGFHLERTLKKVLSRNGCQHLRPLVDELLSTLPQVRLDAHRGDRLGETQTAQVVRGLAADVASAIDDPRLPRELIEHLPVPDRPRVSALRDLERSAPPITLYVSDNSADWTRLSEGEGPALRITLHDIVVPREAAGSGLGSAALQELCRYADEVGATIVGQMMPGPGFNDLETRIPRLAAWYARHGFTAGARPPEQWRDRIHITRLPGAVMRQGERV